MKKLLIPISLLLLIAGAMIRVGDLVADGSARKKLAELRQSVMERGRDAIQA